MKLIFRKYTKYTENNYTECVNIQASSFRLKQSNII